MSPWLEKPTMPAVGYGFRPTDQEIINHFLKLKIKGDNDQVGYIQEIDVCKWEPEELPGYLGSMSYDQEWYFFGRRDVKYVKSNKATKHGKSNRATKDGKSNRATPIWKNKRATKMGSWKKTGDDVIIKDGPKKDIGIKKTLVFRKGRGQMAGNTPWIMYEYCASADKDNPQAVLFYRLKKRTDDNVEIPNTDGPVPNISYPSDSLLNDVPSHSPSIPTVHQGSAKLSSYDQSFNKSWQEIYHAQSSQADFADVNKSFDHNGFDTQGDARYLNGTKEGVMRFLDVSQSPYLNQGPVIQHVELKIEKEDHKNIVSEGVSESAVSNLRARTCSEVPAQASGKKDLLPKKLASKNLEAVSDGGIPEVGGNKSSVALGQNRDNMGFIVYAANPRGSNVATPPSNSIMNIAIAIFVIVVITGEVLSGLVS